MLAERTQMHMSLFREGIEAEFFDSVAEMSDKVRYYLKNDKSRKAVAEAGYRKVLRLGLVGRL